MSPSGPLTRGRKAGNFPREKVMCNKLDGSLILENRVLCRLCLRLNESICNNWFIDLVLIASIMSFISRHDFVTPVKKEWPSPTLPLA